jgi:cold shock CspA family protein
MKDSYLGRIAVFDEKRGLGEVEAAGGLRYPFHCTAIHDGTRYIAVGGDVEFTVVAGPLGRYEASAIRKIDRAPES